MKRVSYTAAEVDAMIVAALSRDMGPEEREAVERRSFVYGNTRMSNPEVTREMVDEVADEVAARRPWTSRWWAAPVALLGLAVFLAVVYAAAPNGPHKHVEVSK